jgi:hypothetical protein
MSNRHREAGKGGSIGQQTEALSDRWRTDEIRGGPSQASDTGTVTSENLTAATEGDAASRLRDTSAPVPDGAEVGTRHVGVEDIPREEGASPGILQSEDVTRRTHRHRH